MLFPQKIHALALAASVSSQLPGRENGPADAYRHIFASALISKYYGENFTRFSMFVYEAGNVCAEKLEGYMDYYNNELGIRIGNYAREHDLGIRQTLLLVCDLFADESLNLDGIILPAPKTLERERWNKNPKDKQGNEIPTDLCNFPDKDRVWLQKFVYTKVALENQLTVS